MVKQSDKLLFRLKVCIGLGLGIAVSLVTGLVMASDKIIRFYYLIMK
jgi:hypothetical protein